MCLALKPTTTSDELESSPLSYNQQMMLVLVFEYKSNCFYEGSGTIGGMLSSGVFLWDLAPLVAELFCAQNR